MSGRKSYNTNTRRNSYQKSTKQVASAVKKLPDKQKKIVLFAIIGVVVLVLLYKLLTATGVIDEQALKVKLGLADKPATNAETSVHFVDVGQGDCELIISNGEAVLIDAGELEYGNAVVQYLEAQGVKELKYVIVSHQHTDHMGGMNKVLERFEVGELIMPPIPDSLFPTNSTYDKFLDILDKENVNVTEAENCTLKVGDVELKLYVQDVNSNYEDLNDFSIAVKAVHGDNSFVFAGDLGFDGEDKLAKSGYDLSAKVMKVNHHGSGGSNGYNFLEAVSPDYAIIPVGKNNDYGHPKEAAIKRINKYCDKLYRTDINGNIVFESDGEGLSVILEKE